MKRTIVLFAAAMVLLLVSQLQTGYMRFHPRDPNAYVGDPYMRIEFLAANIIDGTTQTIVNTGSAGRNYVASQPNASLKVSLGSDANGPYCYLAGGQSNMSMKAANWDTAAMAATTTWTVQIGGVLNVNPNNAGFYSYFGATSGVNPSATGDLYFSRGGAAGGYQRYVFGFTSSPSLGGITWAVDGEHNLWWYGDGLSTYIQLDGGSPTKVQTVPISIIIDRNIHIFGSSDLLPNERYRGVRVWNRALSSSERTAVIAAGWASHYTGG